MPYEFQFSPSKRKDYHHFWSGYLAGYIGFQFSPSKRKDYHSPLIVWSSTNLKGFNLVPPKGRIITLPRFCRGRRAHRFNLVPPKGRIITYVFFRTSTPHWPFQFSPSKRKDYHCPYHPAYTRNCRFNLVPPKGRIITSKFFIFYKSQLVSI